MLLLKEKEQGNKLFFKLYGIFNMDTNEFLKNIVSQKQDFLIGYFGYELTLIEDFYNIDLKERIKLKDKNYNINEVESILNFLNDSQISVLLKNFLKPDRIIIPYEDLLLNKNLNTINILNYLKKTEKVDENCFVIPNIITNTILLGKNKEKYELIISIDLKLI